MRDLKPMILFVDDEELARRTFSRIAEKEFRVVLAESVDDAIKVLENQHEDIGVLLSDQRMPGRLGVDLLEHCRKNYPRIVRMLTTAYSELNDAIAAVNRGEIMRYIEKPWGNIDGLLIDLRVAVSLFEMRAENDLLVTEKLAMGYKTSRLDKIRTLIAIAASQSSKNSLRAIETLLRQIADIDAYRELPSPEEMQTYQVFGQPLNDSIIAVEIGGYLVERNNTQLDDSSWDTLIKDGSSRGIQIEVGEGELAQLEKPLARILYASKTMFGDDSSLKSKISFDDNGIRASVYPISGHVTLLSEWLTGRGIAPNLNTRVAALLEVFFLTFSIDGHASLVLSDLGLVERIDFHFYGDKLSSSNSVLAASYDWIDDLMILFS